MVSMMPPCCKLSPSFDNILIKTSKKILKVGVVMNEIYSVTIYTLSNQMLLSYYQYKINRLSIESIKKLLKNDRNSKNQRMKSKNFNVLILITMPSSYSQFMKKSPILLKYTIRQMKLVNIIKLLATSKYTSISNSIIFTGNFKFISRPIEKRNQKNAARNRILNFFI